MRTSWNKGLTKETNEKLRKIGEKISNSEYHKNCSGLNNPNYGKKNPELSERNRARKGIFKHTKETKLKIKEKLIGRKTYIVTEKSRENMSKSQKEYFKNHKSHWEGKKRPELTQRNNNPEFRKKLLKALMKKPTLPEQKVNIILQQNFPNNWKYVGNGEVILGGKCPDFINNGEKKIIEVFGRVFHDPQQTFKKVIPFHQTEKGTIDHYKKYGYNCLIIWDDEQEEKMLEKINIFQKVKP
jgi:hypothetical protein